MQKGQDTWGERQISTDSAVISACGQPPATLEDSSASRLPLCDDDLYSKPRLSQHSETSYNIIGKGLSAATIGRWFDSSLFL